MRSTPIFLLCAAALINCATLTPYAADGCGNRVVESGEDCDDAANPQCKSCRLRCDVSLDGGAALACPDGWGCGTDKICRQMTGVLKPATAAVSASVVTLKAGDFDADGRTDIIGSPPFGSAGSSRVHYFDGSAGLSTITALDVSIAIPIVKNLDDNPGDDIGFSVRNLAAGAFGALSGQPDRTFSTIVFPLVTDPLADTRFIPVNATPASGIRLPAGLPGCAIGLRSGFDPMAKAVTHAFGNFCAATPAVGQDPGTLGGMADFTTADVQGMPKAGRVFALDDANGNGSACGQIVFTTADAVKVMSPCTAGTLGDQKVTWRSNAPFVSVKLPGTLVEEIYVGPVDTLARDEIVVHVEKKQPDNPKEETFYVLDRATGSFVTSSKFTAATGLPLAGGDLDGDGIPDFVLATGIKLSTPNPLTVGDAAGYALPAQVKDWTHEVATRDQLRWTQARIGRFNNDELPDVLVSFTNSLDVDLMSNSGGGRFVPFTVRSEQIVRGITSGDFDGDRIDDVAFFQSASDLGTADETTLTLAFGNAVGGPAAPRTAGKFKYARAFGPLLGADGTDNLAVVQIAPNRDAQPVTSLSVLFGNGGRQPVAPLFMLDPADPQRRWEPVSFNIGAFPGPGTQAIIAIATGFLFQGDTSGPSKAPIFRTQPWLSLPDSTVVGGLEPFAPIHQDLTAISGIDQAAALKGRREIRLITATGDIDVPKNGTDELVNMAINPDQNVVSVVVVHTQENSAPDATVAEIPDARVDEGDPIELFDVDRDGFVDIVYIITVSNRRTLSVLRGNGSGGFISPPITTAGTDLEDDAIGFAKLDSGSVTKVAVVTRNQLWLVNLGKDGQFHASNATSVLGSTTSGITAIAGGDINGDGVPDLAIAQAGSIRVIPQKPTTE